MGPVPDVPVLPCWANHVYDTARFFRVGLATYQLQKSPLSKVQRDLAHLPSSEPSRQLVWKLHTYEATVLLWKPISDTLLGELILWQDCMLSNLEIIGWGKFRGQPKLHEAIGNATKSQECSPTSLRQPTRLFSGATIFVTGTLRWLTSLYCLLYFLAFDWLRPTVLFLVNCTVCLF